MANVGKCLQIVVNGALLYKPSFAAVAIFYCTAIRSQPGDAAFGKLETCSGQ
jgi:hypothetical protein